MSIRLRRRLMSIQTTREIVRRIGNEATERGDLALAGKMENLDIRLGMVSASELNAMLITGGMSETNADVVTALALKE
jgi:hypothetical protein